MPDNKILKVSDSVTWVGVLDPDIVTFDVVMETKFGTTYNSYFINADKKTVIETVKEPFREAYFEKLRKVTDLQEIQYIILNHTEPDHSGCVAALLEMAPAAMVISSGNGIRYLRDQIGHDFPNKIVKDGQVLDLGNRKLRFISAPNLHWPDSMFTYLEDEKILFTCDAFGEHYCNEAMFDDVTGDFSEAFRYYFDVIMKPFSKFVLNAISKVRNLDIETICPGHGTIYRSDWKKYVDLTEKFAKEALEAFQPRSVFVAYVSAYRNTRAIAEKIAEGVKQAGDIEVDLCDIEKMSLGEIEQKLVRNSAIILGSPTFNQNVLLPVYQVMALINPIRDKGKLAAAFGSYGWSGEGTKIINSGFASLKLNVIDEGLMVKFTPHREELAKCLEYGKAFGEKLLQQETK